MLLAARLTRRRMTMAGTLLNCDEAVRFIEQIDNPVTKNLPAVEFLRVALPWH
jgi:hypothetical protein